MRRPSVLLPLAVLVASSVAPTASAVTIGLSDVFENGALTDADATGYLSLAFVPGPSTGLLLATGLVAPAIGQRRCSCAQSSHS